MTCGFCGGPLKDSCFCEWCRTYFGDHPRCPYCGGLHGIDNPCSVLKETRNPEKHKEK